MASIHREVPIETPPEAVWDALRDIGAIHQRLAPGFVTDVRLEPGARVVTFGNGMVARELAPTIAGMIDQGLAVIKPTLERTARR